MKRAIILTILTLFSAGGLLPLCGQILPADRRINWSGAGVTGGIPSRTAVYATLNPGATAAQINTAISNCPAGQVVHLNAGTYNLNAQLRMDKSNSTLRGAGPGKTILNLTTPLSGGFGGGSFIWLGKDNWQAIFNDALPVVNISSGTTRGSKTLTVSSASGIAAGDLIILDEVNDTWVTYISAPSYLSRQGGTRTRGQMNEVVSVAGNTVTLRDTVFRTFTATPQAVILKSAIITKRSGIENLTVTQPGPNTNDYRGAMICLDGVADCWVRNVEIKNLVSIGIEVMAGLHTEFRDNYIHDSGIDAADGWVPLAIKGRFGNSYGYAMLFSYYNSLGLTINNIFKNVGPGIELIGPTSGNVVAYNYFYNVLYNNGSDHFQGGDFGTHGGYPMLNLFEGNSGFKLQFDNTNGSSGYNTVFRHHSKGFMDPAIYHAVAAMMFWEGNNFMNALGCVLGIAGKSNLYETGDNNDLYGSPAPNATYMIWTIGNPGDTLPPATTYRWGNYDYMSRTTRYEAAEVPTRYGVPVPADHTLPASLFLSAKPAWFTTPWGTPAWPPVGPDVTGGNADSAGHVCKLPAQLCYENTIGQGLDFDPVSCYNGGAGIVRQPAMTAKPATVLEVSPNPFTTMTYLHLSGRFGNSIPAVRVYDLSGRMVGDLSYQVTWNETGDGHASWKAGNLPAGIYLVRASAGTRTLSRSLCLTR